MFDGRDYHQSFEKARDELAGRVLDRDEVLGQLIGVEWTLWEAIRGAMFVASCIAAFVLVAPIAYFSWRYGALGWIGSVAVVLAWLSVATGLYWLFRATFHYEVTRHVKGRRFGHLDLPWLPGSTNFDPTRYPNES